MQMSIAKNMKFQRIFAILLIALTAITVADAQTKSRTTRPRTPQAKAAQMKRQADSKNRTNSNPTTNKTNDVMTANNDSTSRTSVSKDAIVEINTTMGPIKILLYGDTPLHRENFLKLAKEGYYDGVLFHRVIKDFMVQTGDPDSKDAAPGKQLGTGDPGYTIPAEINYPHHYHKYGALAAARTGDQVNPERRSSGSQFYIVTGQKYDERSVKRMEEKLANDYMQQEWMKLMKANASKITELRKAGDAEALEAFRKQLVEELESNVTPPTLPENIKQDYIEKGGTPHLDNQYTVFGEVLEGMDTVEKIQNTETGAGDRPKEDVKILSMKVIEE